MDDLVIILVYERLPDFCFAYDRIGHEISDCDDEHIDKENPTFGNWLQASAHT